MVFSKKIAFFIVLLTPFYLSAHGPNCGCGCNSKKAPAAPKKSTHGSGCSCSSCSSKPQIQTQTRDRSSNADLPFSPLAKNTGQIPPSYAEQVAPKKLEGKTKKKKGWFSGWFSKADDSADADQAKSKKISDLEYKELKKEKERQIARGDKYLAIKYLERMAPLCSDLGERAAILLELADLLFETKHMVKAERLYLEFMNLFPGDERTEYAHYRALVCCFDQISDYYRDQTKTQEAVELAQQFLSRKEVFVKYTTEVVGILQQCHEKLLESEMNIFNFYLKQGKMLAAETRLKNIEKEYIALLPEQEPLILTAGCNLAEKKQDPILLAEKKAELDAKFPNYTKEIMVAKAEKKRTSFVDKF